MSQASDMGHGAVRAMNVSAAQLKWLRVLSIALCLAGVYLRCIQLGREGFWLDEVFGASYTNLTLPETLVAVLRFDLHPPLYYWQLNIWSWLGQGDVWLLLNSAFWSSATLLLLAVHAWRSEGAIAGVFVCAFLAVCSTEVFYAGELRMYAMLSCLGVLGWRTADRYLTSYDLWRDGRPLLLVFLAISMTHSMGILIVSALLVYIFPWQQAREFRQLRSWLWMAVIAALFLAPWLLNASFRSTSHTSGFSAETALLTLGTWLGGTGSLAGLAIVVFTGWLLTGAAPLRRLVASFVVWPLLLAAVLSVLARPVWIPRIFVFSALMFWYALAIQLAGVWGRLSRQYRLRQRWGMLLILGLAAGLSVLSVNEVLQQHKAEYREAAASIRARQEEGSLVYIPQNVIFWGIARYLVGPEWGSLLAVQDPDKPDFSERWRQIYSRLGGEYLRLLHLQPATRVLDTTQPPMVVGWSDYAPLKSGSYWVLGDNSLDLNDLSLCASRTVMIQQYRGVRLHKVQCSAASQ